MENQKLQQALQITASVVCDAWDRYWNYQDLAAKKQACQHCESVVKSWVESGLDDSALKRCQSLLRNQIRQELATRGWVWTPGNLDSHSAGRWQQLAPHEHLERLPIANEPCTWVTVYAQSLGTIRDTVNHEIGREAIAAKEQPALVPRIPLPPSVCQLLLSTALHSLQSFLAHQSPRLTTAALRVPHQRDREGAIATQSLTPVMTMVPRIQLAYDAAIAIVILTGRRPFLEVLRDARFQATDDGCLLMHSSHKNNPNSAAATYKIRPLADPHLIVNAHFKVLSELTVLAPWYSANIHLEALRQQTYVAMEASIQQYLPCLRSVMRQGFEIHALSPLDGRIWYAQIAFQRWKKATGKTMDEQSFIKKVLIQNSESDPLNSLNGDRISHRWLVVDTEDLAPFLPAQPAT